MAKFRKWTVKNTDQKKQYKTAMGTTDYDIPMFGYKSVLLIIAAMVVSMFVIPAICDLIHIDFKWPFVIIGGFIAGFSVSFSQYFVNSKKGITKAFWNELCIYFNPRETVRISFVQLNSRIRRR